MAFQMDAVAVSGVTQTYHVVRSHAVLRLIKTKWQRLDLWIYQEHPLLLFNINASFKERILLGRAARCGREATEHK